MAYEVTAMRKAKSKPLKPALAKKQIKKKEKKSNSIAGGEWWKIELFLRSLRIQRW